MTNKKESLAALRILISKDKMHYNGGDVKRLINGEMERFPIINCLLYDYSVSHFSLFFVFLLFVANFVPFSLCEANVHIFFNVLIWFLFCVVD